MRHMDIKGLPKDSFDERGVRKTKEHFEELLKTSKPKLITYGEFLELDLYAEGMRYDGVDKNDALVTSYAVDMLKYCGKIDKLTKKNWMDLTGESERYNRIFHAGKLSFLLEEYKNHGFYSIPQSIIRRTGDGYCGFMHPGSIRRHAMYILNCVEENIILWDDVGLSDKPELTWEEFLEFFNIEGQSIFAALADKCVEMHTSEDREKLYNITFGMHDIYGENKPVVIGEVSGDVQSHDIFDTELSDGYTGIVFETKDGYVLQMSDLKYVMYITNKTSSYETENFTIYHKQA